MPGTAASQKTPWYVPRTSHLCLTAYQSSPMPMSGPSAAPALSMARCRP